MSASEQLCTKFFKKTLWFLSNEKEQPRKRRIDYAWALYDPQNLHWIHCNLIRQKRERRLRWNLYHFRRVRSTFLVNTFSLPEWHCDAAKRIRTILFEYDCDCLPFFENKLEVVQACIDLAGLLTVSVFSRYRGETCMKFRLTTNSQSIDSEFVCDWLQNTVWLDDTNNNFGKNAWNKGSNTKQKNRDRIKLGSNNNINKNNWKIRDAKSYSSAKKKECPLDPV